MPDSLEGATILVVDDDPTTRAVLVRQLSRAGFVVVVASTAAEGWELAPGVDLCIIDVRLPDRPGHDLVEDLRAQESTASTPIVLRTSFDTGDATMIEGIERGADAYLVEPISRQLLLATVRNLIRQRVALERLSMAVAATGVGAWSWNAVAGRMAWNDSLETIHGFPRGSFAGSLDAFLETVHPEDRAGIQAHLDRVASGLSNEFAVLHRFVHADGSVRWLQSQGTARRSADGQLRNLAGVAVDVTDREGRARVGHRLLDLGASMAATDDVADLADLVVTEGRKVFEASGALLARVAGDTLHAERSDGFDIAGTLRPGTEALARLRQGRPLSGAPADLGVDLGPSIRLIHVLPLVSGGSLFGALVLGWPSRPADYMLDSAAMFANLVAQTLARARLADEQRQLGQRFQHSMRPPNYRSGPLTVTGRYDPAADSVRSAGDWMDVVDLGDDSTALIIGDVVGHGVEAAVRSAAVRYAVRAAILATGDPSRALAVADRSVPSHGVGFVSTALCAVITASYDQVYVASAGHPGPIVVTSDGARWLGTRPGPPLGSDLVGAGPAIDVHHLDGPWSMLLFTDGLVETRGGDLDANVERLCRRLTDPAPKAVEAVLDTMGHNPADDMAVLLATTVPDGELAES
jgi:PAS domain S-box-containing protein